MYIEKSKEIIGYTVKVMHKGSFHVKGYTIVTPPGRSGEAKIPRLWDEVIADGRLSRLIGASSVPPCVLGLGSWDPECSKGGQRYTICLEEAEHTDFTRLSAAYSLFTKKIGASDWLCFETRLGDEYPGRFWKDNPYQMMGPLGYKFHGGTEGDYSLGLHFEVYPPGFSFGSDTNTAMEFWISVEKA
jgi:hypothetical protein